MTEDELATIDARATEATPGPWSYPGDPWTFVHDASGRSLLDLDEPRGFEQTQRDAAFIAASREDVPALVAEVRRLREALAWYGDLGNYLPDPPHNTHAMAGILFDCGGRARAALERSEP